LLLHTIRRIHSGNEELTGNGLLYYFVLHCINVYFPYNRDDLVHGFILVYSTKRKASLATLVAFSQNIPNLPIQILAVTESGGAANAFFNSELSHQLITAGNAAADRLQVCYKFGSGTHTHTK
jgi:hypothetical protein